jgi:hypothetical protein
LLELGETLELLLLRDPEVEGVYELLLLEVLDSDERVLVPLSPLLLREELEFLTVEPSPDPKLRLSLREELLTAFPSLREELLDDER